MDKGTRALPGPTVPKTGPTAPSGPGTGTGSRPRISASAADASSSAHRKDVPSKGASSDSRSDTKSSTRSSEQTENEKTAREAAPDTAALSDVAFVNALLMRLLKAKVVDDLKTDRRNSESLEDGPPSKVEVAIGAKELIRLTALATTVLLKDRCLLRIDKSVLPLLIVGDIHGQFIHLRSLFEMFGGPSEIALLFLGDYVDRGVQGVECMCLLLTMKIRYPTRVFMLRGNHEDANTTLSYGFHEECRSKYGPDGQSVWEAFVNVFNVLPLAAIVNRKIFCVHGGLSPWMESVDEIDKIDRPLLIPAYGLATDLVWSDPDVKNAGWSLSTRGVSFNFDTKAVEEFCKKNNIDLIVRGHQISTDMHNCGYKFACGGRLITIFSAPNYLNYHNAAAVLRVPKEMNISIFVFRSSDDAVEEAERVKKEQFMKEREERRKARKKEKAPAAVTPAKSDNKKEQPSSDCDTSTGDASEEDKMAQEHSARDLPDEENGKKTDKEKSPTKK